MLARAARRAACVPHRCRHRSICSRRLRPTRTWAPPANCASRVRSRRHARAIRCERNLRVVAGARRPKRGRTRARSGIRSSSRRSTRRSIRSRSDAMFTLKTAFLSMPARRASASRRFRSRIWPRRPHSTPRTSTLHLLDRGPRRCEQRCRHASPSALSPCACPKASTHIVRRGRAGRSAAPGRPMLGDPARFGVAISTGTSPFRLSTSIFGTTAELGRDFRAALESPLQWIFEKAPGYLSCSFSAADEYLRLPTAELEALAWSEVQTFVPALDATLIRSAVTRNPEATWLPRPAQPAPCSAPRSAPSRSPARGPQTGWPDTMESAVRSGTGRGKPLSRATLRRARRPSDRCGAPSIGCSKRTATEGWWSAELETNVTMTAEQVLLYRFLACRTTSSRGRDRAYPAPPTQRRLLGALLRRAGRRQHDDRSLRRAEGARRRSRARRDAPGARCDRAAGRRGHARVFTKIWLALFGVYPWSGVPSLPPELVYFPLWMPFNLYDFACWARGTVAPLTIVVSKKPVRELGVDVSEIIAPGSEEAMHRVRGSRLADGARESAKTLRAVAVAAVVATTRSGASRNGWSSAKKPTEAGAASSRRGSIR